MADIIEVLINGSPLIIVAIISAFGGYLVNRFKPKTIQDKVDQFEAINDAFKCLNQEYKKESEENKKRYEESQKLINELRIDMEKMKEQIKYLSDYKRKYSILKSWSEKVYVIAEEEDISLPFLDSEVAEDIKNLDKKNFIE